MQRFFHGASCYGNIFLRYGQYVLVYSVIGMMPAERRILKDFEERSPGLIETLFRHLIGLTRRRSKTSIQDERCHGQDANRRRSEYTSIGMPLRHFPWLY